MGRREDIRALESEGERLIDQIEVATKMKGDFVHHKVVDKYHEIVSDYNELLEKSTDFVREKNLPDPVSKPHEARLNTDGDLALAEVKTNLGQVRSVLDARLEEIESDNEEGITFLREDNSGWRKLLSEYTASREKTDINEEIVNRLIHTNKKSAVFHTVATHLVVNKQKYSSEAGIEFQILESSVLQASYSLRESMFNLVNTVWGMGIQVNEEDEWKSSVIKNLPESKSDRLRGLLSSESALGEFLKEYRHQDVHDETTSKVRREDIISAVSGEPQPHLERFISSTEELSEYIEGKEAEVREITRDELGL